MSTEFWSQLTSEIGFVRWAGGPGGRYEFGTMTNFESVVAAVRAGDRFDPIDGRTCDNDPVTVEDLERLVVCGCATFGDFPITVALGSGEAYRFWFEE